MEKYRGRIRRKSPLLSKELKRIMRRDSLPYSKLSDVESTLESKRKLRLSRLLKDKIARKEMESGRLSKSLASDRITEKLERKLKLMEILEARIKRRRVNLEKLLDKRKRMKEVLPESRKISLTKDREVKKYEKIISDEIETGITGKYKKGYGGAFSTLISIKEGKRNRDIKEEKSLKELLDEFEREFYKEEEQEEEE